MFPLKRKSFALLSLLFLSYAFAWILQDQLFLNWDASWLLHAANRLLQGGTYTNDFFETNPPLILYLHIPPLILHTFFKLKLAFAFRFYIFLLGTVSLALCYSLLQKLFSKENPGMVNAFIFILSLLYLVLPLHELGQRDPLAVIFTLPYLLAIAARLQNQRLKLGTAIFIGSFAALGFALKPHFLIIPLLLELYYIRAQKKLLACLRPETLALFLLLLSYAAFAYIFYPDYFSFIIPFTLRVYYSGISAPWALVLLQPIILFCCFVLLTYLFLYRGFKPQALGHILALALVSFILSYITQRTDFYYHLIPAFSLAILLSFLSYEYLISPSQTKPTWLIGLLALLFFSVPSYLWYQVYLMRAPHREALRPLVTFLKKEAAHQSVYFFAPTTIYTFPTIDYAEVELGSRFPFMWMVAGLVNQSLLNEEAVQQHKQDKLTLGNMIAEDLNQYQPLLVFIDIRARKPYLNQAHFDYLVYFSDNPQFRQAWKDYHYLTTLEKPGLYQLAVYKRKLDT
jgi:hypothetical protein